MSVVDLAEARLLREVARRAPAGQLVVDWVLDDDGLPIVKIVFNSDPAQVSDPHAFLTGYLPSLVAHLRTLAADTSTLVEESPLTSGAYAMPDVGPTLPEVPLRSHITLVRA